MIRQWSYSGQGLEGGYQHWVLEYVHRSILHLGALTRLTLSCTARTLPLHSRSKAVVFLLSWQQTSSKTPPWSPHRHASSTSPTLKRTERAKPTLLWTRLLHRRLSARFACVPVLTTPHTLSRARTRTNDPSVTRICRRNRWTIRLYLPEDACHSLRSASEIHRVAGDLVSDCHGWVLRWTFLHDLVICPWLFRRRDVARLHRRTKFLSRRPLTRS